MLAEVEPMGGWAVGERMRTLVGAEPFSVVEVAGRRLIELKVGHGLRIGRVEALVEQEVTLRRPAGRRERRRPVGEVEVQEDGGDNRRVGEEGEDAHGPATGGAEERHDLIDAGEEHGPPDARGGGGPRRLVQRAGSERSWVGLGEAGCLGRGSTDDDDGGAQTGMRGEDAVVAVAVHARRWHKGDEALEELERR